MKNILQLFFSSALALAIASCEKAENKVYFEGGTPPALAASAAIVTLEPGLESNPALVLSWTNPDYKFTTGLSSQDVSYTIEMDTLGGNFSSSTKYSTVIANDLSKVYSVGDLNGILGNDMQLQLDPRRNYTVQARITSSIGSTVKLTSNVVSFTTKPFAPPPKVAPPSTGELFITGDATDGGWMAGGGVGVPVPAQQFTKVSATLYTITVHLNAAKAFLFLPLNGDWGNKYACHDKAAQSKSGGTFGYNGGDAYWNADMPSPADAGMYKITVDFQLGLYSVVKQ